jgi:hypothetical protein
VSGALRWSTFVSRSRIELKRGARPEAHADKLQWVDC